MALFACPMLTWEQPPILAGFKTVPADGTLLCLALLFCRRLLYLHHPVACDCTHTQLWALELSSRILSYSAAGRWWSHRTRVFSHIKVLSAALPGGARIVTSLSLNSCPPRHDLRATVLPMLLTTSFLHLVQIRQKPELHLITIRTAMPITAATRMPTTPAANTIVHSDVPQSALPEGGWLQHCSLGSCCNSRRPKALPKG